MGLNRSVKYFVVPEDFLLGRSLCREGEGDKFPAIFGRMQEKNRSRMLSVLKSSVAQIVAMLHEEQRLSVQRSLPWLQNSKVICVADERTPKQSHQQHTIHHLPFNRFSSTHRRYKRNLIKGMIPYLHVLRRKHSKRMHYLIGIAMT